MTLLLEHVLVRYVPEHVLRHVLEHVPQNRLLELPLEDEDEYGEGLEKGEG